ncbi:hypothetical protein E6B08_22970 [Pseudomonas putida]|uniref:Uncharacterized protein n=1 Tax=Pseudomonas putida TaxID=303 RepID=A0A4D6XGL3_PSEPU|nr:hypothetical protein [Pseudomonas putida]QCI14030.1 hypothetical protein E6B08_22970 [Pseudomonas putida]
MKLTNSASPLPPLRVKEGQPDYVQINPSGISQNTDTHIIGITEDKLHRILGEYQQSVIKSRDWMAPLGILLSLVAALCTSNFNDFIVPAYYWKIVFISAALISGYATFTTVCSRIWNSPLSVKELVDVIAGRGK